MALDCITVILFTPHFTAKYTIMQSSFPLFFDLFLVPCTINCVIILFLDNDDDDDDDIGYMAVYCVLYNVPKSSMRLAIVVYQLVANSTHIMHLNL